GPLRRCSTLTLDQAPAPPAGLDEAAVQSLQPRLRGRLLRPGESDYDAARRVWNAMIDRQPALIARCAGTADVIAAVQFARERELLVSIRGGGHSAPGPPGRHGRP